jgi:hypothetical protein
MKTNLFSHRPTNFLLVILAMTLGCQLPQAPVTFLCNDANYPYWCPNAKKCCPYPFHDGKNGCHQTLAGCQSGGNTCEACAIEAGNPVAKKMGKVDGTYSWSLGAINGISSACTNCATIVNGQLTIDGTFLGPITLDNFNNLTFYGNCPNGSPSKGTFTGKPGSIAGKNSWIGTWTCADGSTGGSASVWKLY